MTSKWTYLTHTIPGISPYLLPLKMVIRTKLVPGRPQPNDTEQDLLAPTQVTDTEFLSSTKITEALKEAITQVGQYIGEVVTHQLEAKKIHTF